MSEDADVLIGRLELFVLGREFENSDDYWDGNWLRMKARIAAVGAMVETEGPFLRIDELSDFLAQLESAVQTLSGEARLETLEPNLKVTVAFIDALGHAEVRVDVTPDQLVQQHRFIDGTNQSYLQKTVRQLRAVLRDYPLRGETRRSDWRPVDQAGRVGWGSRLLDVVFGKGPR